MTDPDTPASEAPLAVLLVEDTLEEALMIRTLVEREMDCKVTLAQDGIRGCELAENHEWDLVIVDLNLPGRDGMEVIKASEAAFPDTPILVTTGYTEVQFVDQALRSGADEALVKPVDHDELLETVDVLLESRREQRESATAEDVADGRSILALGALPGDVELGCGGILFGHRAHGHSVATLVMCAGGDESEADERRREAEKAAGLLGGELMLADPFRGEIPPVEAMLGWTREAIDRYGPDTIYTPSSNDVRDSRIRTFEAAVVEASELPNHYCYEAATTTLEFRPSLFIDVAEHMEDKLEALRQFRGEPDFRPHLQPDIARSSAQYWGRFIGYGEAEPLEVVRSEL